MSARIDRFRSLAYVVPALLLVLVFVYYPIFDNLRLSFFKWSAFSTRDRFVGLDNYAQAVGDPIFWSSLVNNLFFAVVSVLVQVGLGLVLAAVIEEFAKPRIRAFLRSVYFIPAVMSLTVVGLLFRLLYDPQLGLINQALIGLGYPELARAWLGEEKTAIWAIIAMSQWQSTGYIAILFIVAMQKISRELYEAAYMDGASRVQAFFKITVPLVREMTTLMLIITISGAFLVFSDVMVMTGGGPNNASQVLGTWLYRSAFLNDDGGYAAAIATVIFVITFGAGIAHLLWANRGRVEA